jgi:hypothetical protein
MGAVFNGPLWRQCSFYAFDRDPDFCDGYGRQIFAALALQGSSCLVVVKVD